MAALLALGGCGRKGPLDPPPGASATGEPAPQSGGGLLTPMTSPIGSSGTTSSGEASIGPDGRPVTPKGRDRPFILDGLLN
jgi:hypothetical protein